MLTLMDGLLEIEEKVPKNSEKLSFYDHSRMEQNSMLNTL